ncbi:hypothetical protein ACFY03_01805 [Micromonospora chersina]|uniref:hypothetical protein n=1 Tax=Micromonospora chersina TaxID=47854 RepID=UPI0036BA85D3
MGLTWDGWSVRAVDDGLVRDVTEILTSLCVGPFGRREAANHARRAVEAATGENPT